MTFFSAMAEELGARRRRLRASLGERGQAFTEFLVMAGLVLGSLGLFLKPWMAGAAPWGFAIPFVFVAGFLLIEARRQAARARQAAAEAKAEPEREETPAERRDREAEAPPGAAGYDWAALLWSFGCAIAGAAAFLIALGAEPPAAPEQIWVPPDDVTVFDLGVTPPAEAPEQD